MWPIFAFLFFIAVGAADEIPPGALIDDSDTLCRIDVNRDLGSPQPLYMRSDNGQFVFPSTSAGIIELNQNESIDLFCASGFRGTLESHKNKTITAYCVSETKFRVDQKNFEFNEFACHVLPPHQPKRTNRTCTNGQILEVGFQTETNWLVQLTICHNFTYGSTRWVQYTQNPWNQGYQQNFPRIRFIQGDLYEGLNVEKLYSRYMQRQTISKILGSDELGADLVADMGELFLSRGHMAAKSDFVFGSHMLATFYFINVAPQWQSFNGGNWAVLESYFKRFVDRRNISVEMFTGTYGVVEYRDVNGVPREIYLASNGTDRRIPIPKVYYKVAIDHKRRTGVAFVGVNNPYATMEEILKDYVYCENVMDQIKYIPYRPNLQAGYMYACAVNDFAKAIGELPDLPVIEKLLV